MREYLFRGKMIANGKWSEGNLLVTKQGCCITPDATVLGSYGAVDPETVGQYTGLTDKNGTKIFEGDIVKYGDTVHNVVFEQRNVTAYFGLVYSTLETLSFGYYQDLKQIEVIGNIYDNHELVEGEEKNIEDTLKNLSNSNTFTALKLAVHALEKQVPKKLKEVTRTSSNKKSRVKAFEHNYNHQNWQDPVPIPEYKEWQWTDYQCPICNALIKEGRPEFCWRCGQAFEWSKEGEK